MPNCGETLPARQKDKFQFYVKVNDCSALTLPNLRNVENREYAVSLRYKLVSIIYLKIIYCFGLY
jgi:hypothetical protein